MVEKCLKQQTDLLNDQAFIKKWLQQEEDQVLQMRLKEEKAAKKRKELQMFQIM